MHPFRLRRLLIVPLLFGRAQREDFFTVPHLLRKLCVVPCFCALSAKKKFCFIVHVFLRKLFIVFFGDRSAKKQIFYCIAFCLEGFSRTLFLRAQREENFDLIVPLFS